MFTSALATTPGNRLVIPVSSTALDIAAPSLPQVGAGEP
jgi:hypothetical protein